MQVRAGFRAAGSRFGRLGLRVGGAGGGPIVAQGGPFLGSGDGVETWGTNLTSVTDFSGTPQFLNLVKSTRPLFQGFGGGASHDDMVTAGHIAKDGYPISIPDGGSLQMFWAFSNRMFEYLDGKDFVLRWTGDATFAPGAGWTHIPSEGSGSLSVSGCVLRFTGLPDTDGVINTSISILSVAGLSNLSLVREDRVAAYDAGGIFEPDWTSFIAGASHYRYMDWVKTNGSAVSTWITEASERTAANDYTKRALPGDLTYSAHGVPWEVCLALSNQLGADAWVNCPTLATNDYMTKFAALVQSSLNPDLKVYVEYGNEIWNFLFASYGQLTAMYEAAWPLAPTDIAQGAWSMWGKRSTKLMQTFKTAFSATPDRVKTVMGAQTGTPSLATTALDAPYWQTYEPETYVNPALHHDYIAFTSYFGSNPDETFGAEIEAAYNATPKTHIALLDARWGVDAPDANASVLNTILNWGRDMPSYISRGITKALLYEGGNHMLFGNTWQVGAANNVYAAISEYVESEQGKNAYVRLADGWRTFANSAGPFSLFAELGPWNGSGLWTLKQGLYDEPPAFLAALKSYFATHKTKWWTDIPSGWSITGGAGQFTINSSPNPPAAPVVTGGAGEYTITG